MKFSKLKKKMPEKKGEEMEGMEMEGADMEAVAEEADAEAEPMEQEMSEESLAMEEAPAAPELEAISDEELMAELKKRGLMSQMEEGEEEADEMPMA